MFVRGRENRPRSIIIYIYISERNSSCYVDLPPWGFAIKRVFPPHFRGLCLFTRVYPWLKDTETINVCCDVVSKQSFVAVCKFLITAWNPSRETPSSFVWICQNKTRKSSSPARCLSFKTSRFPYIRPHRTPNIAPAVCLRIEHETNPYLAMVSVPIFSRLDVFCWSSNPNVWTVIHVKSS